jgi:ADP-ribose pyrophosphatase
MTPEQKIILVRQFRPAIESYTLEFPSGYINKGESKEVAAKRELREETGFICNSMFFIGSFNISPSRINSTSFFFIGKDAKMMDKKRKEEIEVLVVKEEDFEKLVMNGQFSDISGLAIYFIAKLKEFL